MPNELESPQFYPFYYDPRYEPGGTIFRPVPTQVEVIIQALAREILGRELNESQLEWLKIELDKKNMLGTNPGDQSFRDEVINKLKKIHMAEKVVSAWKI